MRRWLGESERGGRRAEEGERKKGDRLIVAASGRATNDDDADRRDDEPERREDDAGQARHQRRDQCREHHDGEAEYDERFARAESAHGAQMGIVAGFQPWSAIVFWAWP